MEDDKEDERVAGCSPVISFGRPSFRRVGFIRKTTFVMVEHAAVIVEHVGGRRRRYGVNQRFVGVWLM